MKILVVGGTHGNERTGVDTVLELKRTPVVDVDTLIANPRATKRCQRFIETDLNRSFGVQNPKSYEERRALRLVNVLGQYDLIVEFHNTGSRTTCGIVTTQEPTATQLRAIAHLGLDRIVIMPAGGHSLSSRNPLKTVSLEISNGADRFSPEFFVRQIASLDCKMDTINPSGIEMYRYRGVRVSRTLLAKHGLEIRHFVDFQPIDQEGLKLFGLDITKRHVPFLVGTPEYGEDFAFNVAEILEKGGRM